MIQFNIYAVLLFFALVSIVALLLTIFGARVIKGLGPKSMYNVAVCLIVASLLSGCLSLFAVWIALQNNEYPIDYTHQDVVVDILGVLVTILMGWNIISVVDIKKKAEDVGRLSNDFGHVVTGIMRLNMRGFMMRDDKDALIDSCFTSLQEILYCDSKEISKSAVEEIMYLLHQIYLSYNGNTVYIYPNKKQKYLFVLGHDHLQSEYKDEIKSMIETAKYSSLEREEKQFALGNNKSDAS